MTLEAAETLISAGNNCVTMRVNRKGEINKLTKIIRPNIGVITNISYAHIKNFNNLSQIANAKSEIINNIISGGAVVLNKDDDFFNFFKSKAKKKILK